jgi:chaperone required for assembly of F1-ATPase
MPDKGAASAEGGVVSENKTSNGHGKEPARIPGKEALAPPLPRRFYKVVDVAERDGAFCVELDGRLVKTPRKRTLALPTRTLAAAVAAEWQSQGPHVDPATMPLTRIANSALDAVADGMASVAEDIAAFAGSDLLCYRAEAPLELVTRQMAAWDPVLDWAASALGTRLQTTRGIVHVGQPDEVRAAVLRRLAPYGPLGLAALHVITTLTGSALLALAHADGVIDAGAVWAAAHVDEDWQIEHWGQDSEAAGRRRAREAELRAASLLLSLL